MTILCYHSVDPDWSSPLSVTPEALDAHLTWLVRHRRVVDIETALAARDGSGRLPRGLVALTFDDGLAGLYEHAWPVLRRHGVPATVFLVSRTLTHDQPVDWVDTPPRWPLRTLTREQIREMQSGGVRFESHSASHRHLPGLDPEECERDLVESREVLSDLLGRPVRYLAYPRGKHDAEVRAAASRAGFTHAFTLPEGREPVGDLAIPRVGIYPQNRVGALRTKTSRAYLPARTHPAFPTVRDGLRRIRTRSRAGTRPLEADDGRLRIAYVMSRFPRLTETFVLGELRAMEADGVDVDLYPLIHERTDVVQPDAEPYVARAHYAAFLSPRVVASNLAALAEDPRRYLSTLGAVLSGTWRSPNFLVGGIGIFPMTVHAARRMRREGVDHVHCHFANHPALAGFIVSRLTGIPFSFTAHGSDLHVDRTMLGEKVRAARFVATVSAYNRELILAEAGADAADRVHVVHCGVDTQRFVPAEDGRADGFRVVCVGTLHEVKGQSHLLEAFAAATDDRDHATLTLVGDGPDRGALQRRAAVLGISDRVVVTGRVTQDRVLAALHAADVLVAPSVPTSGGKREGIPVVLMEAMACGLPVVSSRLSGIPELVEDGVSGLLTAPGDVPALTEALRRLADDPVLRSRLAAAGRRTVEEHFDLHRNTRRLRRLITDPTPSRPHIRGSTHELDATLLPRVPA